MCIFGLGEAPRHRRAGRAGADDQHIDGIVHGGLLWRSIDDDLQRDSAIQPGRRHMAA